MQSISKLDAAHRQVNAAIRLLFAGGDPIAAHTLAVAGANVYSDLLDKNSQATSWRERIRVDHGMTEAEIRKVLHKAWNFFKHGDRDPQAVLEFDPGEAEYIIFHATLECGELATTSTEMQVFQLWFLASGSFRLDDSDEIQRFSEGLFPGLADLPHGERLQRGHEVLMRQLENDGAET